MTTEINMHGQGSLIHRNMNKDDVLAPTTHYSGFSVNITKLCCVYDPTPPPKYYCPGLTFCLAVHALVHLDFRLQGLVQLAGFFLCGQHPVKKTKKQ